MSLSEMLFIGFLGLVVFGPRKLAAIAPEVGKTLARLKSATEELKSQIEAEVTVATDRQAGPPKPVDHTSIPY